MMVRMIRRKIRLRWRFKIDNNKMKTKILKFKRAKASRNQKIRRKVTRKRKMTAARRKKKSQRRNLSQRKRRRNSLINKKIELWLQNPKRRLKKEEEIVRMSNCKLIHKLPKTHLKRKRVETVSLKLSCNMTVMMMTSLNRVKRSVKKMILINQMKKVTMKMALKKMGSKRKVLIKRKFGPNQQRRNKNSLQNKNHSVLSTCLLQTEVTILK